jgi:hypothetical protein
LFIQPLPLFWVKFSNRINIFIKLLKSILLSIQSVCFFSLHSPLPLLLTHCFLDRKGNSTILFITLLFTRFLSFTLLNSQFISLFSSLIYFVLITRSPMIIISVFQTLFRSMKARGKWGQDMGCKIIIKVKNYEQRECIRTTSSNTSS